MAVSRRIALSGLCFTVCVLLVCRVLVFSTATVRLATIHNAASPDRHSTPIAASPSARLSSFDPNALCTPPAALALSDRQRPDVETSFSHVNISGDGWSRATAHEESCFRIQAFASEGGPFDVACSQRAFFVVTMRLLATADGSTPQGDVLTPRVQYLPESSSHKVCYRVQEAGLYEVEVALVWTNAFLLRQTIDPSLAHGFHRSLAVAQQRINVADITADAAADAATGAATDAATDAATHAAMGNGTTSAQLREQGLPFCTFAMLKESRNPGFWRGDTWHPTACRLPDPITPSRIGRCLHGKSVLILGDSEMRYLFGNLQILLHFRTRCRYMKRYRKQPRYVHRVRVHNVLLRDEPPMDPDTGLVMAANYSNFCGQTTYWGNFWSGFALQQVQVHPVRRHGPSFSFNLTYATHMGSHLPLFDDWRTSPNLTGGPIATDFAPYDIVAASFGLHDITHKNNAQELSEAFKSVFLPSLRSMVRDPDMVTFFGMWAAQEKTKPERYRHKSNNVRGFTFDDTIARVSDEEKFGNFVDLQALTLPRADRCTDSAHYSWPVTLAMLDIWLSAVCQDVDSREREPRC